MARDIPQDVRRLEAPRLAGLCNHDCLAAHGNRRRHWQRHQKGYRVRANSTIWSKCSLWDIPHIGGGLPSRHAIGASPARWRQPRLPSSYGVVRGPTRRLRPQRRGALFLRTLCSCSMCAESTADGGRSELQRAPAVSSLGAIWSERVSEECSGLATPANSSHGRPVIYLHQSA